MRLIPLNALNLRAAPFGAARNVFVRHVTAFESNSLIGQKPANRHR